MSSGGLLQGGKRRRPRRFRGPFAALLALCAVTAAVYLLLSASVGSHDHRTTREPAAAVAAPRLHHVPHTYGVRPAPPGERVRADFRKPPGAGLLFDLRTGRVLWTRGMGRRLPIASLTKMMTALVVVAHVRPTGRVLITRQALNYRGSGVGVLPLGRRIPVETMLYGLLLVSGNDAAIALAQRVSGRVSSFVRLMNDEAHSLGLRCTRFSSPDGLRDQGNYSCARDLAIIARELLRRPRLARIVRTRRKVLPFPIRGGRLDLFNHNPLLRARYPGTDGVKTGYTYKAGRCLVAAAHRGRKRLGVVILHSLDPPGQAETLFARGFHKLR
jgi:D-alanyl-D-alanine carboxypeptidase